MFSRFRIALMMTLLLAVAIITPVFAGGWAVITLDRLPTGVIASEPFTVGFTVLQHGKTPLADINPTITATLSESESFVVQAKPEGKTGHYSATLTFPKEGNWSWSIQAFTMDQAMPELNVAAPTVASAAQRPDGETRPISPLVIVRILALVIGSAGLVVAYQRKSRLAGGLVVLCLLVGVGSFVTGSSIPVSVEAQSQPSSAAFVDPASSPVELGEQLFIVKGCITCHVNTKVKLVSTHWTIDMGAPDLSKFSASPEVLRLRLKDPKLVKSDTQMPNLHLADDEIEALIAFINSK